MTPGQKTSLLNDYNTTNPNQVTVTFTDYDNFFTATKMNAAILAAMGGVWKTNADLKIVVAQGARLIANSVSEYVFDLSALSNWVNSVEITNWGRIGGRVR